MVMGLSDLPSSALQAVSVYLAEASTPPRESGSVLAHQGEVAEQT